MDTQLDLPIADPHEQRAPFILLLDVSGPIAGDTPHRILNVMHWMTAGVLAVIFVCANVRCPQQPFGVKTEPGAGAAIPATPRQAVGQPAHLKVTGNKAVNPRDGAALVLIPAGSFQMGDDDQEDNPRHTVKLSGYWMYKNMVTVGQYKKFCKATGKEMPTGPSFDSNWSQTDHPVVNVSWDDAAAYCKWAAVRLPTEAQWEKAAGGADGRKYPWGNNWDPAKCANSVGKSLSGTVAVDHYTYSPYGLSDMAGNAWEWCADWYDDGYCKSDHGADPKGPASGQTRVLRGGSWVNGSSGSSAPRTATGTFPISGTTSTGSVALQDCKLLFAL